MSETEYIFMYIRYTNAWVRTFQTEIALSTTKSEYIVLSAAMQKVIPFLEFTKDIDALDGPPTRKQVFK